MAETHALNITEAPDAVCKVCNNVESECVCCPECGHDCPLDVGEEFCPICGDGAGE